MPKEARKPWDEKLWTRERRLRFTGYENEGEAKRDAAVLEIIESVRVGGEVPSLGVAPSGESFAGWAIGWPLLARGDDAKPQAEGEDSKG